jgi:hypothetical protein
VSTFTLKVSNLEHRAKAIWNDRRVGWCLAIIGIAVPLCLFLHPQPPGYAIALSGGAAAIMSLRDGYRERIFGLVIVFVLLGMELHAISVAQNDNKREQTKLKDQFQSIADKLNKDIETGNTILKQATSAGSYCYVEFLGNDKLFNHRAIAIATSGQYSVYDIEIIFSDIDGKKPSTMDNLYPNALFYEKLGNLAKDRALTWKMIDIPNNVIHKRFGVIIFARNGFWSESIDIIKSNDGWHDGFQVTDGDGKVLKIQSDKPFMDQSNIRWTFRNGQWQN